jgi:hypothetical protein
LPADAELTPSATALSLLATDNPPIARAFEPVELLISPMASEPDEVVLEDAPIAILELLLKPTAVEVV